jgi:hypothetical protein
MQGGDPVAPQRLAPAPAHHVGDGRERREASFQRPEIEAGPAGDHRKGPARPRGGNLGGGFIGKDPGRPGLGGAAMAIEAMRHLRRVGIRGTGGEDLQLAIALHGVGIDDDATKGARDRQGRARLAACRRPCNKHGTSFFAAQ